MTVQRDPSRCWVRIDTGEKIAGGVTYTRTLIGDAWALEPFGPPGLPDEFSLVLRCRTVGANMDVTSSTGMRLDREAGEALHAALGEWLHRGQ